MAVSKEKCCKIPNASETHDILNMQATTVLTSWRLPRTEDGEQKETLQNPERKQSS